MADHQAQREVPAAARAEDRRRTGPERVQQPRRVVGLLLRRGRVPTGRNRASRSANASKWPPSPVDPMISRTGGPVPRTSWYSSVPLTVAVGIGPSMERNTLGFREFV